MAIQKELATSILQADLFFPTSENSAAQKKGKQKIKYQSKEVDIQG